MTNILFTNVQLTTETGTEVVTRDLALGLHRRGHRVAVYTPSAGAPATRLVDAGVPVVTSPDDVPFEPDVVHAHHHTPTIDVIGRFPECPVVWVCHDRLQYEDIPPLHPAIRRYVAVDLNCRERLTAEMGIPADRVDLVHNAVDVDRFRLRPEPADRPRTALVFSNQARPGGWLDLVRAACDARGIELDVIGSGVGTSTDRPEALLTGYDIVFGKARCALEALASGCAVVLVDQPGFGGLVTMRTVEHMRDWNFGTRCLQVPTTAELVGSALDGLVNADARAVSHYVRTVGSLDRAIERYLEIYTDARSAAPAEADPHSLRSVLAYAGALERRLRVSSVPAAGMPLPPGVNRGLDLHIVRAPGSMHVGQGGQVEIALHNASIETLSGAPPHPVVVGYRWHDRSTDVTIVGPRTALPAPLHPGGSVGIPVTVQAPGTPGEWQLVVTLVQELVAWHDELDPPLYATVDVVVHDGRAESRLSELVRRTGESRRAAITVVRDAEVRTLAFADDFGDAALVYATSRSFLAKAVDGVRPAAVLTTPDLVDDVPLEVGVAVSDDPTRAFYELHNALLRHTAFYGERPATSVDATAVVEHGAHLDPTGVVVGAGCHIHAGAVVRGPAVLGRRVVIESGAVIGAAGFQTSSRSGDAVDLHHAGGVHIGDDVHVHANAVVAAGPFDLPTQIGAHTQIGNGAFVSHRCRLGQHVYVGHLAALNGRVEVGDGAWIGPGAVVAHRLRLGAGCAVALGSTVVDDVEPGAKVSGLPAGDQHTMFRHAVAIRRNQR